MKFAIAPAEAGSRRESGGLAGWLLEAVRLLWSRSTERRLAEREMRLVETLSLGGRRQLLLVVCGSERFLIGTGADSVETIVQIAGEGLVARAQGAAR